MSTAAKLGKGTTFEWDSKKVGNVKKINAIPMENTEVDVTDLDSTAKESIPGLKDYGTFSIEGNYVPTDEGQAALQTDAASGAIKEVVITYTTLAKTATFSAYVKSLKFGEATTDGVISFTADIRITGDITFGTVTP